MNKPVPPPAPEVPATEDPHEQRELEGQAAILDALPATVALINADGFIVSVNAAWREFAAANQLRSEDCAVGLNYLDICDTAHGADAAGCQRGRRRHTQGAARRGETLRAGVSMPQSARKTLVPAARLAHGGRRPERCRGHAHRRDGAAGRARAQQAGIRPPQCAAGDHGRRPNPGAGPPGSPVPDPGRPDAA